MSGVWVKICGVTTEEDALLAIAMGADAIGFIFAPSTRQVRPFDVADIIKRLPPEIMTVGVFKDEVPSRVIHTVRTTGLRAAQLNGNYTAEQAKEVRRAIFHVFCGFSGGDPRVARAADYDPYAVLLDGPKPGSGQTFDWALADDVPTGMKLVVAGGLNADNVADAINAASPWGVDAASGVEASPGRKDPVRLKDFIAAARAARPSRRGGDGRGGAASTLGPGGTAVYDWQEDGL